MKFVLIILFCAAPLWGETSAKALQADVDLMLKKAGHTAVYRQVFALSAEVFADEACPADLKIELAQTITLPALDAILRRFAAIGEEMQTGEGKKLVAMNAAVVEKLKEAYTLYLKGLKSGDDSLRAKANIMAAVEAPALSVQAEEYSFRLREQYQLLYP